MNGNPHNHTNLPQTSPHNPPDQPAVVAIIPARYASVRLPGKPLLEVAGRPLVLHTVERAMQARSVSRVIVATDDVRIFDAVRAAGYEARMTSERHPTGTDRLAEVVEALDEFNFIVNVQADEPLIAPETIDRAVERLILNADAEMATTSEEIGDAADVLSSDVVKVVVDERGCALYFSRSPIPFPRDLVRRYGALALALELEPETLALFRKHTGLYVYRRSFLLEYARWQPSALEELESLEQLRALARGVKIQVVESHAPSIGVDTEADLARVRRLIEGER